jgi:hypothetical protein
VHVLAGWRLSERARGPKAAVAGRAVGHECEYGSGLAVNSQSILVVLSVSVYVFIICLYESVLLCMACACVRVDVWICVLERLCVLVK